MRSTFAILIIALAVIGTAGVANAGQPAWAYGISPPAPAPATPPPPDTAPRHLEGAPGQYTRAQIGDQYGPVDWYPGDHPQMPDIVAHGKKADAVAACSLCHYPNGKGRPENAGVSGLPVAYFIQTMNDFKSGA